MSLGNNIAEFVLKMTSVRQTDLGGGQRRLEVDYAGEVSGPVAGNHYGTLAAVFNENDDPARPNHFSWTGTTLTESGAIVNISAWGLSQGTWHKGDSLRLRSIGRLTSTDSALAAYNNQMVAFEGEFDPATGTLKGAGLEWK